MANSPGRASVDVGSVIADTYTLEALLGRGGMGAVFLASHRRLAGKQVAIKILHTEIEDADIVARFKREAEIAAKLNHPNIVGVVDYNVSPDGMPYLVLDYLEGETLAQRIARGPMPLDQVLSILRQIGSALAAAHRAGIVHRDLKPQNIFLVPTEIDSRWVEIAKVLDFGISKIRGSQTVKTQDSTLLGTPQYMAPEQATGQHALIDERTDEFALGAIVYEMLSGQPAFSGASIPEVVFKVVYDLPVPLGQVAPGTPAAIIAAVDKAMAKPPEDRFATVTLFVEAVTGQPLTVTRGVFAAPVSGHESPSGSGRRVTTREAFDQTMGPAPSVAPMAQGTANKRIPASTANTALATPVPSTVAGHAPGTPVSIAPAPGPARSRPIRLFIAIALAAAAAAVLAVVVLQRPPARTVQTAPVPASLPAGGPGSAVATPPPVPTQPPQPPQPPTPQQPAGSAAPPPTAGTGVVTAPPPPTAPDRPRGRPAHTPVATGAPAPAEDDGDDDTRDKLQHARAALQGHHYADAEQLANAVLNSPAGPRARASAHLIRGMTVCESRVDQEAAQIDLRALQGFPAMRSRLFSLCKSRGVLQ
ncbi:MAG TPA: protein kinase [Kofleriaceae bacterium]